MKKFCLALLLVVLCFTCVIKTDSVKAESKMDVSSKSAYLIDVESGTVLFSKNENARLPIASMTKLMLLLLTFENVDSKDLSLNEKIIVSPRASSMGGSQVFLESNGEYLCSDLVKSIVIASANDASVAMAERLYGSEENAVEKMNEKAKELGMENTLYSNCTGLSKPTQYSCAKDCATLLSNVVKHKEYFEYSGIWMDEIKHPSGNVTGLTNTNKLIKYYSGCDGGKTGFTSEAGFCLSATAKRGGMRLVCVVINCDNSKTRFKEVSSMFNYGFDNYTQVCVVEKGEQMDVDCMVKGGKRDKVSIAPQESFYIFAKKNVKINEKSEIELFNIKAPVKKGDIVGKISIYVDNVLKKEINLVSTQDVKSTTLLDGIKDIVTNW